MYYPVCVMVHINESMLLIRNNTTEVDATGFLSYCLSGTLQCVLHN